MRIKTVSVQKLFGLFDHRIQLHLNDRITIIHGPNGFGKTALLRMVHGLFNRKYSVFRSLPYGTFSVAFEDNSNLTVQQSVQSNVSSESKSPTRRRRASTTLELSYESSDGQVQSHSIDYAQRRPPEIPLSAYDEILPQINRVDFEEWLVRDTGERIGIQEVLERYSEYLPIRSGKPAKVEPEWYKNLRESLDVRFIQTQRLFAMENSRERMQQRTDSRSPAVKQYSDELAKEIQSTLARYGSRSQELDRTFPSRLFQQTSATTLSAEELMKRFEKIEDQRSLLTRLGFLEAESVMTPIPQQGSDEKRDVLSVYIQDVEHKFSIFDELAAKIEFLTNIVNRRFLYKKLSISKDTGFVFRMDNETPLSPIDLSSGEQHELVLLYELLFKVKPNSLLLIDEPEISLHMGWQEEFLGDLQRAVELSGFDVLVATHAAGIIGDRWDLTVELQGPTR